MKYCQSLVGSIWPPPLTPIYSILGLSGRGWGQQTRWEGGRVGTKHPNITHETALGTRYLPDFRTVLSGKPARSRTTLGQSFPENLPDRESRSGRFSGKLRHNVIRDGTGSPERPVLIKVVRDRAGFPERHVLKWFSIGQVFRKGLP